MLEITQSIAIINLCYGAVFGFLFIIFYSAKVRNAPYIPDFLKVKQRPEGKEVFWWPGTGNAR